MYSFTTTLCAIFTDLRAAIAHIAAGDRAHFFNFFRPRISHTAQLFDLFERLVAEWRNGTLPDATACHPSPIPALHARRAQPNPPLSAAPGSSPNRACPSAPPPARPDIIASIPQARRVLTPIRRMIEITVAGLSRRSLPLRAAKPISPPTPTQKFSPSRLRLRTSYLFRYSTD